MNKKFILLFALIFFKQQTYASSDWGTTVALGLGGAAGYFSKVLFYENPDGFMSNLFGDNLRAANEPTRKLCTEIKRILQNRFKSNQSVDAPQGDEMKAYILALRTVTGLLTFGVVKLLY